MCEWLSYSYLFPLFGSILDSIIESVWRRKEKEEILRIFYVKKSNPLGERAELRNIRLVNLHKYWKFKPFPSSSPKTLQRDGDRVQGREKKDLYVLVRRSKAGPGRNFSHPRTNHFFLSEHVSYSHLAGFTPYVPPMTKQKPIPPSSSFTGVMAGKTCLFVTTEYLTRCDVEWDVRRLWHLIQTPSSLTVSAMFFAVEVFSVMLANGLSAPQDSILVLVGPQPTLVAPPPPAGLLRLPALEAFKS